MQAATQHAATKPEGAKALLRPRRRRRAASHYGESRASTARRRLNNRAAMARYRKRVKTQGSELEARVESLTSELHTMLSLSHQEAALRRENAGLKLALAQCAVEEAVRARLTCAAQTAFGTKRADTRSAAQLAWPGLALCVATSDDALLDQCGCRAVERPAPVRQGSDSVSCAAAGVRSDQASGLIAGRGCARVLH